MGVFPDADEPITMMRVGVEVGGTFTDLVAIEDDTIRVSKVPSTPAAPHLGALSALDTGAIDLSKVDDLIHGSTVATNAILNRVNARPPTSSAGRRPSSSARS